MGIPFPMFRKANLFFSFLFPSCLLYISISQKVLLYLLILIPEEFPWRCKVGGYRYAAIAVRGAVFFVGRLRSWLSLFKCLQLLLSIGKDSSRGDPNQDGLNPLEVSLYNAL